jgi:multidrug efflux pump subunit AcrA (membrane-fusion protein)
MKKTFALITTITILAIFTSNCGSAKASNPGQPAASEFRNVSLVKVGKSSIEDLYEATGTVKAKTTTQISANMMGRILSFPVAEGDTVTRGQLLVEIDSSESRAQLEKGQAALNEAQASLIELEKSVDVANAAVRTTEADKQLAEATFGRYKELFGRGSASAQEFDEAQSKLRASNSEVERARSNVSAVVAKQKQILAQIEEAKAGIANTKVYEGYSKIFAPVSGVVVKKLAEAGSTAVPGAPLLSIEDSSQYRLEAAVEESHSKLVRVGGRVNVRIDALGENWITGTVAEVLPTLDAASRSHVVKIDLPTNVLLRTGQYGLAEFPTAEKEAITLPQAAIVQRGQLTGVYVVGQDSALQFRIITTGKNSEGMVEVLSGIAEGDEVASSDVEKLRDGIRVR